MTSSQKRRSVRHIALIVLLTASNALSLHGDDDQVRFRKGKEFEKSLAEVTRVSSILIPLQVQLDDLMQSSGLAIHRDRRIDPGQPISLETDFLPRVQVLARISSTIPGTSICVIDDMVVLGPSPEVHRLPALVDQTIHTVREVRRSVSPGHGLTEKNLVPRWEMLAEPRQILVESATAVGLRISNPEAIPHDVWDAGSLPSMSFANLAAVILNEFDLMLAPDTSDRALMVSPIPRNQVFTHRYIIGTSLKSRMMEASQKQLPKITAKWTSSAAEVSGIIADHAAFNELLISQRYNPTPGAGSLNQPLRKMAFQLQEGRMTAKQLIENLQKQRLLIEVRNSDSPETRLALSREIHIQAMSQPIPATRFFEMLFGELFVVDLQDDKVVLIVR